MIWGDLFFWPFVFGVGIVLLLVKILILLFIIWMIVDCAKRPFRVEVEKWIWIFIIFLFTWLGAMFYYILIRVLNQKGVAKK